MFSNIASKHFPGVEWHGNSDIHVSVCWNAALPLGASQHKEILSILDQKSVGSAIYRSLVKKFPGLVWIVTPEEFSAIFMVDCYRHLQGEGDSRSPSKIKNPYTGNYFHRVAVKDDLVLGIRYWCDPYGPDETILGFRFRIQKLDEDEEETRRRTRDEAIEAMEVMEEVVEFLFDVKEPSATTVSKVDNMVMSLADDD